jgi:hypothetical protein
MKPKATQSPAEKDFLTTSRSHLLANMLKSALAMNFGKLLRRTERSRTRLDSTRSSGTSRDGVARGLGIGLSPEVKHP